MPEDDSMLSALDEDDFQTVIIENKLGCEVYVKKVEQTTDSVEVIYHDTCSSIWMSPPRFSDRVNTVDQYREARHYVAVQIIEAKVCIMYSVICVSSLDWLNFIHDSFHIFYLFSICRIYL